ncbi:hypothetical protein BDL97_10G001200 [Sphagnum fallax]|nr:hypothetical protein BDL97_10G001200 [Sphagnum fallax]KAH8948889.1 hypothetical protein BDL97_10G001200 [Sphagnum fallax]
MEQTTSSVGGAAAYVIRRGFKRVALQFPDELLEQSVSLMTTMRGELNQRGGGDGINLYVLADTTYGSCCVDEVAAAHVDAQCVVHFGHACLSRTSRLPVYYVFGNACINVQQCVMHIAEFRSLKKQALLVLFELEYAHAMEKLEEEMRRQLSEQVFVFAQVPSCEMEPLLGGGGGTSQEPKSKLQEHRIGGLKWCLTEQHVMEDYAILWIGEEGAALTNVMLTYNTNAVAKFDPSTNTLVADMGNKSKSLMRRFYLVQQAKDASVVGIVVGTLGVAGYVEAIQHVRNIVKKAGKKPYTIVIGKPNPSKLANFPECDVFVLVACPQTVLIDSKEYLAPVITPYEAEMAFVEGKEWTGAFSLEFEKMQISTEDSEETSDHTGVDGLDSTASSSRMLIPSEAADHTALQLHPSSNLAVVSSGRMRTGVKSSADYLALRSYQGLEMHQTETGTISPEDGSKEQQVVLPSSFGVVVGRTGRAAGYNDEKKLPAET